MKIKFRNGFSLTELLVIIGVFSILVSMSAVNFIRPVQKTALDTEVLKMVTDIKSQQIRSMLGYTSGQTAPQYYGVNFSDTSYTLFNGYKSPALSFGGGDVSVISHNSVLNGLGPMTISLWIYPTSNNGSARMVSKDAGTNPWNSGWEFLLLPNGRLEFSVDFSGSDLIVNTDPVVDYNEWHHVAAIWDGTNDSEGVIFYLDGLEVEPTSLTNGGSTRVSDSSSSIRIGNNDQYNSFVGRMDEVRIYNTGLSQDQVILSMTAEIPTDTSNLVGYWRLNENTGQNVYDETSYNSDGFLGPTTGVESTDPAWGIGAVLTNTETDLINEFNGKALTSTFNIPGSQVVFERISGEVFGYSDSFNSIVVSSNGGETKTININKYGAITIN